MSIALPVDYCLTPTSCGQILSQLPRFERCSEIADYLFVYRLFVSVGIVGPIKPLFASPVVFEPRNQFLREACVRPRRKGISPFPGIATFLGVERQLLFRSSDN
jgi:hypothetical protein